MKYIFGIFTLILALPAVSNAQHREILDDFEAYSHGDLPTGWGNLDGTTPVPYSRSEQDEVFQIVEEAGGKYVRAIVRDNSHKMILRNGDQFQWDLRQNPTLSWDWRAVEIPPDAREDKKRLNDVAAAVYVTYKLTFMRVPRSIKYTYSSTLPVGTTIKSSRNLWVVVVASAADGLGEWQHITRNVAEDYRKLFGRNPPDNPLSVMLWSDSDNTNSTTIADFDNIAIEGLAPTFADPDQ